MASRVVTQMISDISGEEIDPNTGGTIEFAYRGTSYSIDLTEAEAAAFDEAVVDYIEHATQQGRARRRSTPSRSASTDAKAIRSWAKEQGLEVPARGRIPSEIREQYAAAH